ncbi:DUF342 domain-containing protein [Lysinibacillus yapensis]|uniref:DUF342 domain-containing protein n=1 Tax=Ureibacillus yapensis TaxID=2304605 RepID=A0A396SQK2_9BACL|nr:FapA family protein [Lysinibacillus yapensis]RHW38439.1 DUF342 domain-containing protein [Lysinibacillus yapensis]
MLIFSNDYLETIEEKDKVYLKTIRPNFPLKEFDQLLRQFPRIRLTNFSALKQALGKVSDRVEIGQWLPIIELEISKDKMSASVSLNASTDQLKSKEEKLLVTLDELLQHNRIVYGIKKIDFKKMIPGKSYKVAEGMLPKKGEDAKITYLEIPERKPVIREDGKADYFEMNFIFEIKEGDWLGEKIPPQPGIDGKNILGESISAPPGDDQSLRYDPKAAYEKVENGKIVLYAAKTGIVQKQQGLLSVSHHLPIEGDVGYATGNITFDGSVTVRGTVSSGFSIMATGDISIESAEGITGAASIKSENGDIYIKGGVFGLGETEIEAGGSIFVKHVNDAKLLAKNEIVIGLYSMGSYLIANSILLDERKGKIIGGKAIAKSRIVTGISGNRLERQTELVIDCLSKQEANKSIQEKAAMLKSERENVVNLTSRLNDIYPLKNSLNNQQLKSLTILEAELKKKNKILSELDQEIKELMENLKNAGKEEIVVTKEAFPGTCIKIGTKSSVLNKRTQGRFLLEFGELNV